MHYQRRLGYPQEKFRHSPLVTNKIPLYLKNDYSWDISGEGRYVLLRVREGLEGAMDCRCPDGGRWALVQ